MSDQQYYYRPNQNSGKKRPLHSSARSSTAGRRTSVIALGLVAAVLIGVLSTYIYARVRFAQIAKLSVGNLATDIANKPMNILLIGSNSRAALNGKQANAFGSSAQVGGARSDVTMIAHLVPATHTITLVSIPRDLFLPIPGSKNLNRVDAALNKGPSELVKTIEQDLGIPIQHLVELNFDTFQQIVNALGGIHMYFPYEVKDALSGLNITHTGCQYLNGFQALAVVRARHLQYSRNGIGWSYDPLGDLSRIRRDHEFVKVLGQQVKAKGIYNPITLNSLVSAITPYLGLDNTFTLSQMITLASTYRNANPSTIATATLPIALENNYNYLGANYGDVVFAAQPQDATILKQYLGITTPSIARSTIPLTVVNGTGAYHQAGLVAAQLSALGYPISGTSNISVQGSNLETIVRYTPGHLADAMRVQADLSGAVVMSQGNTSNGTPVEVITGNNLTVATVASSGTPNTTPLNTPTTATPKPTQPQSPQPTQSATNLPVTLPATVANMPLQPWDPRACPS